MNWHPQSQQIPNYSHYTIDRSLPCRQESILLVIVAHMGKGGHVNRKEPEGPEIMEAYEDSCHIFDQAGWSMFCMNLDGHHYATSRDFSESFNGQWA